MLRLPPAAAAAVPAPWPRAAARRFRVTDLRFTPKPLESVAGKDRVLAVPFKIVRTASGNLPVYVKWGHCGAHPTTRLRGIFGDVAVLKAELRAVCEAPVRERIGSLEVAGLHTVKIKQWLMSLGF